MLFMIAEACGFSLFNISKHNIRIPMNYFRLKHSILQEARVYLVGFFSSLFLHLCRFSEINKANPLFSMLISALIKEK